MKSERAENYLYDHECSYPYSGYVTMQDAERMAGLAEQETEELRRTFNLPERSTDVLQFPQDSGASKRYGHDTVKGDAITSYLIQVTTRPGALVVVPFAGSGTECAMAAKLGRRFVGYEIDPKHARTAARRTEKFIQTTLL